MPKPAKRYVDDKYRAWIKENGRCVVTGLPGGIDAAHVRTGTDAGMGRKPSDWWCIPLSHDLHMEQHSVGERIFENRYGIDMKSIAQKIWQVYNDESLTEEEKLKELGWH